MRITQFTDHALRLLIYLAHHQTTFENVPMIARYFDISSNHLMKVAQRLTKLGYIEAKPGRHGGIRLKRDPQDIIIGQVFFEIEPLEFIEEITYTSDDTFKGDQQLVLILEEALQAFLNSLHRHTLDSFLNHTKNTTPSSSSSSSHMAPKK